MTESNPEQVTVTDKRRIDPETGEVRHVTPGSPSEGAPGVAPGEFAGESPEEAGKAAELLGDLQRVQADFANYRKRALRDQQAAADRAKAAVVSQLLGVLDDLKRALAEAPEEHAVVIGPTIDLEAAASLADNLRVARPAVSVMLMRRRVDTSVLAEALRSGMREVVEERDLSGLGEAIKRAHQV